ncbi:MAG: murein biosynthesis integral membrane protein MurJ [Actinobacteria bacterium]|nr:murein biosynthesis integral membrane protein MurJ [Actinomycetota bacterium]
MAAILRAMLSISAATVLSRATGYARTMAQASVLGIGVVANAYAVSYLLPGLIYELFMGGILYSIFIPLLVDRMTKAGEEDARRLTNALFTLVLPLLVAVTLLGVAFAEPLVNLTTNWTAARELSPEAAQETTDLAVLFFRIFTLQVLFYGVSTIATGVLQSHRHFFLPTFAPVLNNLIVIASFGGYALLVGESPTAAIYVLAAGATFGVGVMALALIPTMWRLGYKPRPQVGHPALAPAARLAGPMLILVAASVGVQAVAYFIGTSFNAAPQLYYAFTIFSLPYGVFVVAVATALMPELSEKFSRGDAEGYRDTLSFGLRLVAFVAIPSTVGLVVLAEPVIALLYERGEFGPRATQEVAALLVAYSVGLLGYATYFLLVRAFYSRQNTLTPALLNVVLFALYVALAYGLSHLFGVVGVALALSGANAALALLGLATMRREIKRLDGRRLLLSLAKMLVAGAAMYAVAWGGTMFLGVGSGALERALIITGVGGSSLAAYLGVALLLKAEELKPTAALLRRRAAEG